MGSRIGLGGDRSRLLGLSSSTSGSARINLVVEMTSPTSALPGGVRVTPSVVRREPLLAARTVTSEDRVFSDNVGDDTAFRDAADPTLLLITSFTVVMVTKADSTSPGEVPVTSESFDFESSRRGDLGAVSRSREFGRKDRLERASVTETAEVMALRLDAVPRLIDVAVTEDGIAVVDVAVCVGDAMVGGTTQHLSGWKQGISLSSFSSFLTWLVFLLPSSAADDVLGTPSTAGASIIFGSDFSVVSSTSFLLSEETVLFSNEPAAGVVLGGTGGFLSLFWSTVDITMDFLLLTTFTLGVIFPAGF